VLSTYYRGLQYLCMVIASARYPVSWSLIPLHGYCPGAQYLLSHTSTLLHGYCRAMSFKTSYCVNGAHCGSEQSMMGYYQDLFKLVGDITFRRKNSVHERIYLSRISALFFSQFITLFAFDSTRRIRRFASQKTKRQRPTFWELPQLRR